MLSGESCASRLERHAAYEACWDRLQRGLQVGACIFGCNCGHPPGVKHHCSAQEACRPVEHPRMRTPRAPCI